MDELAYRRMTQDAVKKKFGSHRILIGKRKNVYPAQAEREYERLANSYMRLLSKRLKQYLPLIRKAAKQEKRTAMRHDSVLDVMTVAMKIFARMADDLQDDIDGFKLYDRIDMMASLTRNLSIAEWKRQVKRTLGVELSDDYYLGDLFQKCMRQWVDDNVSLIKTIPQESLGRMRDIVLQGYRVGKTTTDIMKQVQKTYSMDKRHAQLIARDQVAKLNGQITQIQQQDAGIEEYEWSDSGDERVRERHRELNGNRFKWSEPPIVDFKNMRRCHPGEDYQCRCVALPVFDFDKVTLPVKEE